MDIAALEFGPIQQGQVKFDRGGNPGHGAFGEGPAQATQGVVPVNPPDDQLADQGVVEGRDLIARVDVAVEAHPRAARGQPAGDLAGGRPEVLAGIFGVDPHFNGVTAKLDLVLGDADRLAAGDA